MKAVSQALCLALGLATLALQGCVLRVKDHRECPKCEERELFERHAGAQALGLHEPKFEDVRGIRWVDRGLRGHKLMHVQLQKAFCADATSHLDGLHYGTFSALMARAHFAGANNVEIDLQINMWNTLSTITQITVEYGSRDPQSGSPDPMPGDGTPILVLPPLPAPGESWNALKLPAVYDATKETFWTLVTVSYDMLPTRIYFEEYLTPDAKPYDQVPRR